MTKNDTLIFVSDKMKRKMSSQAQVDQKSKPVHSMHFKCELCKKKYATEARVITHIEKCHDHISSSHAQEYFTSFVATKRARAPADQTPKVKSSQLLAFKCGLCETYLRSSQGIAIHVEVAHGIKCDMIKEAYSVSALPRSVLPSLCHQLKVFRFPPLSRLNLSPLLRQVSALNLKPMRNQTQLSCLRKFHR